MTIAAILLQAVPDAAHAAAPEYVSLFGLLVKGGWIMIPLALLFGVLLFVASDSWYTTRKMAAADRRWFNGMIELTRKGEWDKALTVARRSGSSLSGIVTAGIEGRDLPKEQREEDMQVEARVVTSKLESPIGYLGMIASIAPMLGFLGTIFGVITIFMNISATNELSISSISDGLYQKMICSAVGLLEGIVAYCAYWILNRRVDKMVLGMDRGANIFIKALAESQTK